MKITVCIRQGLDGEINPFDACAYESALQIEGAEITLLSMGPQSAKDFLLRLTRLGAKRAILLSDTAFAGADTLATAYTLSLAIKKLEPDLIFCGRQTLVGDTAQTGSMLSVLTNFSLITNVLSIDKIEDSIVCTTRELGVQKAALPTLLTIERINTLRLPSILSKMGELEVWDAEALGADKEKCGLKGSPTRVLETHENSEGRRNCQFIGIKDLPTVIKQALLKQKEIIKANDVSHPKLKKVFSIGASPLEFAQMVCDNAEIIAETDDAKIAEIIKEQNPDAVIWGSDAASKRSSARIAAMLGLGLCADCTALQTDGKELFMIRPALAGSIVAKIKSLTRPALATVRTTQTNVADILVAVGFGAKDSLEKAKTFAENLNADLAATRKVVDNNLLPYSLQVGLTGKTVSPAVYIAVGISGAVHHIVGMRKSGAIIAINPDKDAPIFDYADYGILCKAEELQNLDIHI